MIGESTFALVFIRTSIFLLRTITPTSFLYAGLLLVSPLLRKSVPLLDNKLFLWTTTNVFVWALRVFCANEVWFYFWSQGKIKAYQEISKHDGLTKAQRQDLFQKTLDSVEDPRSFFKGWFKGAPVETIQKDNMRQWLLWAFFNMPTHDPQLRDIPEDLHEEIDTYLNAMEKQLGQSFAPGYNPKIDSIRLSVDPVNVVHRPACVYLGVGVLYDFLGWTRYYSLGMRHYVPSPKSGHRVRYPYIGLPSKPSNSVLTYWYKPCAPLPPGETEDLPIVFVHGIGAGLKIYRDKITKLCRENPRSAIYLIETPSVTMKFMDKLPAKTEYVTAVGNLLLSNGHMEALFIGHSLGTVIVSWIVHLRPEMCKRVVLIDPVCWLLHLPDVAYNFLHRNPVTANHWLYWYFVSNEPGIAWFLGRGFFWFENALWLDEVPPNCDMTVFLSENDMIVDVPNVYKYLTNESIPFSNDLKTGDKIIRSNKDHPNLKTILWKGPDMDHAVYLLMEGPSADVVEEIKSAVASCSSNGGVASQSPRETKYTNGHRSDGHRHGNGHAI